MSDTDPDAKNWWATMPGVLTALAAIITAVGGLIAVLVQTGLIGGKPAPSGAARTAEEPVAGTTDKPPAAVAAPAAAAMQAPARPYTALRVTARDGSSVSLKPTAEIMGAALPLSNGQEVAFERIASIEIAQPWDGSLSLLLIDGRQLAASAANLPLSGSNDLGPYLAMLSDIRRIDFVR